MFMCFWGSCDDIVVNELVVMGEECGEISIDWGYVFEGLLEDVVIDGLGIW